MFSLEFPHPFNTPYPFPIKCLPFSYNLTIGRCKFEPWSGPKRKLFSGSRVLITIILIHGISECTQAYRAINTGKRWPHINAGPQAGRNALFFAQSNGNNCGGSPRTRRRSAPHCVPRVLLPGWPSASSSSSP